jgi:hypothetical protein
MRSTFRVPPIGITFTALTLAMAISTWALPATAAPAPAAAAGASVAAFDARFRDETMRIDYFHIGNATEEIATLDRVWRQGIWAGSRTHLIDDSENGSYWARVYDAASGELIFSRGFDSYFGEYKTTSPAVEGVRRTYQESVLMPFPKQKVRFTLAVRQRDRALKEIFSAEIDPADWSVEPRPLPKGAIVVEQAVQGDPHSHVDVAILGEGYTGAEQGKFRADLARFTKVFLAQEPYASMADRFNLRGVLLPSQDTGCDEPSRGVHRRTALSAAFDALGSERYLLTEDNRDLRDIAACVPYDAIYIMVNHERYGGGGIYNLYCTFTSDNHWSEYTFVHEFGHCFAGLADEYYTSSTAYNDFYPQGLEPVEPNITALLDPGALKWRDLVTPGTPLPTPWAKTEFDRLDLAFQKIRQETNDRIAERMRAGAPVAETDSLQAYLEDLTVKHVAEVDAYLGKSKWAGKVGAFEGAGYASTGLYRSQLDCIMFARGLKPFCAACRRGIERVIEHYGE